MTEITQELIMDLLPVYFSGEASEETREAVEAYFAENPGFEQLARRLHAKILESAPVELSPDHEAQTFYQMKIRLAWGVLVLIGVLAVAAFFAVAIMFFVQ